MSEALADLVRAARMLLDAESPHMCHRSRKESDAYKAIRAALARIQ